MAKLKEEPEDKLQAAGAADLSWAMATGRGNDKVLQARELEDVMREDTDPTYHDAAKFWDNNSTFRCPLGKKQGRGTED